MGGSWIEIPYEKVSMEGDTDTDSKFSDYLSVLNDNFTIQIILSERENTFISILKFLNQFMKINILLPQACKILYLTGISLTYQNHSSLKDFQFPQKYKFFLWP